jgi:hypothetical protein
MAYTTIDKPTDYFNTVLWTGNGTDDHAITGVGFQPEFFWGKERSSTSGHYLVDIIRGTTKYLSSNSTGSDGTHTDIVKSFDTDGFTLGTNTVLNQSSQTNVAWNWLAGGTASSNTNGDITSSVSANTTAGFSIVSYTGTGSNATVGHGLGAVPQMLIVKDRSSAENWRIYHASLGNTKEIYLDLTNASVTSSTTWNNTTPTSSVFSIGTVHGTNKSSDNYIAYCFAEKKGFSKFGSYTGNGNADGTFVYTGFKPAFLIVKRTDTSNSAYQWFMMDNKRNSFNTLDLYLASDSSQAETQDSSAGFDFLSNGFKLRSSYNSRNASGGTFIYMAFAESPFVTGASGIPCTAR